MVIDAIRCNIKPGRIKCSSGDPYVDLYASIIGRAMRDFICTDSSDALRFLQTDVFAQGVLGGRRDPCEIRQFIEDML